MSAGTPSSPLTPKNDAKTNFSPVAVRESPASKIPQRGNITGNPRKVRDLAADLYNLIQRWNTCHITGTNILAEISQLKLTAMESIQEEIFIYPEGIQHHCDMLEKVCKEMSGIVASMEHISSQLKAMSTLEKYQSPSAGGGLNSIDPTPMFLTWHVERFGEVSNEIASRYSSELEVKQKVLEGVCHCKSRETLMFHVAAWVHQPTMVDESTANIQLESLLLETGHR